MKRHLESHVKLEDMTQNEADGILKSALASRPARLVYCCPPLSDADINENLMSSQMLKR